MITFISGVPGTGKTALAVSMVLDELALRSGRKFFVDGVPELSVEHEPCPPVGEWTQWIDDSANASGKKVVFNFPENSILLVDECQRIYRPRSSGSAVPDYVAALETHRHGGLDIWLISQHAGLIDANVRKLIGRHIHLREGLLGRYLYEWAELGAPENRASRELAAVRKYKLPKRVFSLYKSASLHVKNKRRVPWYVVMFGIAGVASIISFIFVYRAIHSRLNPDPAPGVASASGKVGSGKVVSPTEYFDSLKPRVVGLPHTAPAYDGVTAPKSAPFPAAVGMMRGECRAYTDQATRLDMPQELCISILKGGLFRPWLESGRGVTAGSEAAAAAPVIARSEPSSR